MPAITKTHLDRGRKRDPVSGRFLTATKAKSGVPVLVRPENDERAANDANEGREVANARRVRKENVSAETYDELRKSWVRISPKPLHARFGSLLTVY